MLIRIVHKKYKISKKKTIKDFFFLSSFYKNLYLHYFIKYIVYIPKNTTFCGSYGSIKKSKRHQNVGLNVGLTKNKDVVCNIGLKEG